MSHEKITWTTGTHGEKIRWTTCHESEFGEKYPDGGVNLSIEDNFYTFETVKDYDNRIEEIKRNRTRKNAENRALAQANRIARNLGF